MQYGVEPEKAVVQRDAEHWQLNRYWQLNSIRHTIRYKKYRGIPNRYKMGSPFFSVDDGRTKNWHNTSFYFPLSKMIQRRQRCRRRGRQQRPPNFLSIEALSLVIICIATAAAGERDGGEKLDTPATTTIWPDVASTNDEISTGNKCAGHMTKSKTCGANSNKYDLECCPGL